MTSKDVCLIQLAPSFDRRLRSLSMDGIMVTPTTTPLRPIAARNIESINKIHSNAIQGKEPSRRLRKREADRRSQRQARERTKLRIAHLEAFVEDFRRQDVSGRVATALKKLSQVTQERDSMTKVLKNIWSAASPYCHGLTAACSTACQEETQHTETVNTGGEGVQPIRAALDREKDVEDSSTSRQTVGPRNAESNILDTDWLPSASSSPESTAQTSEEAHNTRLSGLTFELSSYAPNWASLAQRCSCDLETCLPPPFGKPPPHPIWRGNQWTYANEVLGQRLTWQEGEVRPASDTEADDVPIRALLEGWHSLAERGPLHPTWQILRCIDETLFSTCPNIERLALLRAMHTLLQFHIEPTPKSYARLPPWYQRRQQCQSARSYAIDYFAWPGLRDRFVQNEHRYCGNEFWSLFCTNFKLLWPYRFRDCYVQEEETGLYKVSPLLDQRLTDLRCWTMGPGIFRRFPELAGDIPSWDSVPRSLPAPTSRGVEMALSTTVYPAPCPSGISSERQYGNKAAVNATLPPSEVPRKMIPETELFTYSRAIEPSETTAAPDFTYTKRDGRELGPHQYDIRSFNPVMAVDAFICGIIDETEFDALRGSGAEIAGL